MPRSRIFDKVSCPELTICAMLNAMLPFHAAWFSCNLFSLKKPDTRIRPLAVHWTKYGITHIYNSLISVQRKKGEARNRRSKMHFFFFSKSHYRAYAYACVCVYVLCLVFVIVKHCS